MDPCIFTSHCQIYFSPCLSFPMRLIIFVDIRNQLGGFLYLRHNLVKEFLIFFI